MTTPKKRGRPMSDRKKSLIKAIHCNQRWRSVFKDDRPLYEDYLTNMFGSSVFKRYGKVSSKALSIHQLLVLVRDLNGEGGGMTGEKRASAQQIWRMRSLWDAKARTKTDPAMLAFIRRITGKEYMKPEVLSSGDAQKVIIAMERMR